MLSSGPMQPPLLPSSQSPERLRFLERETEPPDEPAPKAFTGSRLLWFAAVVAAFAVVITVVVLLGYIR